MAARACSRLAWAEHKLNHPIEETFEPETDPQSILAQYGEEIARKLDLALEADDLAGADCRRLASRRSCSTSTPGISTWPKPCWR